ncbi:hypothetical protein [Sphingomonas sp.]|uniref:hypothetical protein n=1 Tax=Sphingomonas sp. TaxID=28214 RepID=UPI00325FD74B
MSAYKKLLAGAAGLAVVVGAASPAAAQYYPSYGYGNDYGNNVGGAIGQVINGVISATQYGGYQYGNSGYGQSYGYGGRTIQANVAVQQCAGAVEARLNGNGGGYGSYGGYGGSYGNSGYGTGGRVSGITSIEPRNRGALRVHGLISSNSYGGGYGGYGGYNGGYGGGYNSGGYGSPNLSFTCKVDYSGRVIDLKIEQLRRDYGYRGW